MEQLKSDYGAQEGIQKIFLRKDLLAKELLSIVVSKTNGIID